MDTKDKALIAILGLATIGLFSMISFGIYSDTKKEIEFAKAGLVQKQTPDGKVIWAKP